MRRRERVRTDEVVFTARAAVWVEGRLFPMVDVVVHDDVAPAGCAGGVAGSPWLNVEPPYTPIGYEIAPVRGWIEKDGPTTHSAIVTQALVEAVAVVSRHVPTAAHQVVDVVT
jgi:hypothetical protein